MKQISRCLVGALAVVLAAWASARPARAIEERPLPAFAVTNSAGAVVQSREMSAVPQYVLMYVSPGCNPCDHLVQLLKDWQSPRLTSRVVIIVGTDAASAANYVATQVVPEAGPVTWYADPDASAFRALNLTGTPVLVGVRSGRIVWSVSGVLNDATTVESVVRTWVSY